MRNRYTAIHLIGEHEGLLGEAVAKCVNALFEQGHFRPETTWAALYDRKARPLTSELLTETCKLIDKPSTSITVYDPRPIARRDLLAFFRVSHAPRTQQNGD